jgi:hypothetical protein
MAALTPARLRDLGLALVAALVAYALARWVARLPPDPTRVVALAGLITGLARAASEWERSGPGPRG